MRPGLPVLGRAVSQIVGDNTSVLAGEADVDFTIRSEWWLVWAHDPLEEHHAGLADTFELSTSSVSHMVRVTQRRIFLPASRKNTVMSKEGNATHNYSGAHRFVGSLPVRLDPTKAVTLRSRLFRIDAGTESLSGGTTTHMQRWKF